MERTTPRSTRAVLALSGTGAVLAASLMAAPTASAQIPAPEAPTISTTMDGNHLTINLDDPNRGLAQALTVCTAALLDPVKGVPLIPDLAAGTLPPLDEIDPAVFVWGPSVTTTNAANRQRTYDVPDVPSGVFIALGICINPNITNPAVGFEPVLVGSTIEVGSSVLDLGSAVVDTPGAIGAILDLLGVDTGSLGSSGSSTGSGDVGSGDAAFGSGDAAVGSGDAVVGSGGVSAG